MTKKRWNIAVVGATGGVGGLLLESLEERAFPVGMIKLFTSARSTDAILRFKNKSVPVETVTDDSFAGMDIVFFAAGSQSAREHCPAASRAGAVCIDLSGAWRMDPGVPLVIPEVNSCDIENFRNKNIIATPASSTILMLVALKPLHDAAAIKRIVVSTYQAVSATGGKAIEELQKQVVELLNGRMPDSEVYPHRIAFNCLPQVGSLSTEGNSAEELKLAVETGRILGPQVRVSATAVRVPVFYGHSAAINIETERKLTVAQARELVSRAPGCELVDTPADNEYPMAMDAVGQDQVLVGRIRQDNSVENGLNLWVAADNIRKGAATNAVQIAEILIREFLTQNN